MPVFVTVTLDADQVGSALVDRLAALGDATPLMQDIGEHLKLTTDDRFVDEVGPDGAPWAPLSPATLAASYRKRYKENPVRRDGRDRARFTRYKETKRILQEMGTRGGLRESITYDAGPDAVTIGTNKIYGAIHQFGGQAGRGKQVTIQARPYVGVSDADTDVIRDLVRRFVDEQAG